MILLPIGMMGRGATRRVVEGYCAVARLPLHHCDAMVPLPKHGLGRKI